LIFLLLHRLIDISLKFVNWLGQVWNMWISLYKWFVMHTWMGQGVGVWWRGLYSTFAHSWVKRSKYTHFLLLFVSSSQHESIVNLPSYIHTSHGRLLSFDLIMNLIIKLCINNLPTGFWFFDRLVKLISTRYWNF
jgi:hypothetical protein